MSDLNPEWHRSTASASDAYLDGRWTPIPKRRYEAANRHVFGYNIDSALVACIVERGLDAQAIEFALRRRKRPRTYDQLQILFLIWPSTFRPYQAEFINDGASSFRAIAVCITSYNEHILESW